MRNFRKSSVDVVPPLSSPASGTTHDVLDFTSVSYFLAADVLQEACASNCSQNALISVVLSILLVVVFSIANVITGRTQVLYILVISPYYIPQIYILI